MLTVCCSMPFVMLPTGKANGSVGGPDEGTFVGCAPSSGGLNCPPGCGYA